MKFIIKVLLFCCLGNNSLAQERLSNSETFIDPIEPQPEFPGGQDSLILFLKENMKYPQHVRGKMFVEFFVNNDGTLSDFMIRKGLTKEVNQNVIDVMKKMPRWKPAVKDGIKIRQRMILPLNFTLFSELETKSK